MFVCKGIHQAHIRMLYKAKKAYADLRKDIEKANSLGGDARDPDTAQLKQIAQTCSKALQDIDYILEFKESYIYIYYCVCSSPLCFQQLVT